MAVSTASLPIIHGGRALVTQQSHRHSSTHLYKWGLRGKQETSLISIRVKGRASQMLANPNASSKKGSSSKVVIMVDPLEAKRLAAEQLKEIKAKEKLQRRRQIEAINGAWAMIGLTAGLLIEGQTGKGFLAQLASYWFAVIHFFFR